MLKHQRNKLPRQGAVKVKNGLEKCRKTWAGRVEYRERTEKMWQRQIGYCAIGNHKMLVEDATFDHEIGRGMGGSNRTDAIEDKDGNWINAAVCVTCNSLKGSKRYGWFGNQYKPVEKLREVA